MKEELLQVPSCKHVFHIECIHLWLLTNTTCPLCRCSVLPAASDAHPNPNPQLPLPSMSEPRQNSAFSNQTPQNFESLEQQQQEATSTSNVITTFSGEQQHLTTPIESGSTSSTTTTLPNHTENESRMRNSEPESVIISIQTHGT